MATGVAAGLAAAGALTLTAPAQALVFNANLGPECTSGTCSGSGTARVTIDELTNLMRVQVTFTGLSSNSTTAHIHGPTATPGSGNAGVMTPTPTFPGFPSGVTSGSYNSLFDLNATSSYNNTFLTNNGGVSGARSSLIAALKGQQAYLNIHSTSNPGGEIRGYFTQQTPAPLPMLGAWAGMAWSRRLRRRQQAAL